MRPVPTINSAETAEPALTVWVERATTAQNVASVRIVWNTFAAAETDAQTARLFVRSAEKNVRPVLTTNSALSAKDAMTVWEVIPITVKTAAFARSVREGFVPAEADVYNVR